MPDHVQIASHLGHKITGAVMVVILPVLSLNFVVQINTDVVHHVLRGAFVLHGCQISKTGTQQGKADHAQTKRDQKPPFLCQILHCIIAGYKRIDNALTDVRIHDSKR
ncbi:hypothetical protein D3C81_1843820 [compost metagenome]